MMIVSQKWELGVCTQSLVVLAAAPLLLAGMRAHPNPPNLTPTTLFIIACSTFSRLIKLAKNRGIFSSGTQMPHGAFFTRRLGLYRAHPFVPLVASLRPFCQNLYCLPLPSVKGDRNTF